MQVKHSQSSDTEAVVTVVASESELTSIKNQVVTSLSKDVKVTGFRAGKAPQALVEKQLDPTALQSHFIEEAINQLYPQAIRTEKLRPVGRPEIAIKKFVPFQTLEFEATVPVVGKISLPDYKKIKLSPSKVTITSDDVTEVLSSLQKRMSEKVDVNRAAADGDEVWIDFAGFDEKKQPIKNTDGKNYPLLLGSNSFIPGFEENLIGMNAGDEKTFTLTFPKDYGVKAMASKKVTFTVTVNKVQAVTEPKLDDNFATKAGPFKTLKELKEDIKKQLKVERQGQADREFESDIVREITKKTQVAIPQVMIDEQAEQMLRQLKQDLAYRGQTFPEYLEDQGMTEEDFKKKEVWPQAEERVKASLVLTEISEKENIDITNEELDARIAALKAQYKDVAMQAELAKPEARNEIASRIVTEKTVSLLVGYATK